MQAPFEEQGQGGCRVRFRDGTKVGWVIRGTPPCEHIHDHLLCRPMGCHAPAIGARVVRPGVGACPSV